MFQLCAQKITYEHKIQIEFLTNVARTLRNGGKKIFVWVRTKRRRTKKKSSAFNVSDVRWHFRGSRGQRERERLFPGGSCFRNVETVHRGRPLLRTMTLTRARARALHSSSATALVRIDLSPSEFCSGTHNFVHPCRRPTIKLREQLLLLLLLSCITWQPLDRNL